MLIPKTSKTNVIVVAWLLAFPRAITEKQKMEKKKLLEKQKVKKKNKRKLTEKQKLKEKSKKLTEKQKLEDQKSKKLTEKQKLEKNKKAKKDAKLMGVGAKMGGKKELKEGAKQEMVKNKFDKHGKKAGHVAKNNQSPIKAIHQCLVLQLINSMDFQAFPLKFKNMMFLLDGVFSRLVVGVELKSSKNRYAFST